MLALCKIGAVVIPATHMLTKHDIVYRNTRASIKAIICVDDPYVVSQIQAAKAESPTVKEYITITERLRVGDGTSGMGELCSGMDTVVQNQRSSAT
jgi:acyl-coenzyme A synthetase/AMP-(fatty) acid ligase